VTIKLDYVYSGRDATNCAFVGFYIEDFISPRTKVFAHDYMAQGDGQ